MPNFKPPEPFPFSKPNEWPRWKQTFQRFRNCSKLNQDDEEVQIDSLIYTMGPQAETIYSQLNLTEDESKQYNTVLQKFDEYFQPQKNVIFERAQLNSRIQQDGEPVETFISSLYERAENCGFDPKTKEEAIRDRIVTGIKDKELSKQMQLRSDLTLAKAIELARHSQLVTSQMNSDHDINEFKSKAPHFRQQHKQQRNIHHQSRQPQPAPPPQGKCCMRCGKSHSRNKVCAAARATCHFCHNVGHYAVVCRKKQQQGKKVRGETSEIQTAEIRTTTHDQPASEPQPHFLGGIDADDKPWTTQIPINGELINFKIDSGADVSVMSEDQYHQLKHPPKLVPAEKSLKSYGGMPKTLGMFKTGDSVQFWIYVVQGSGSNLLSRKASTEMGLIQLNVNELSTVRCKPVKITLQENAQPYHVNVARRVPIPLQEKVSNELNRMETEGVIRKVTEPTDWCAPMVVVLKKNGSVRICVDLKGLNKFVKRERYVIPTINDILPKLSGSVMFSRLDAASGYWQLPLDPDSAKLTTFITPQGRYCFQRLPFGISSASEIFQREVSNILEGIDGVMAYQDDIIICGKTTDEHDQRLRKVLAKLKVAGMELNSSKCEMRKTSIKFLGHHISKEGVSPDQEKVEAITKMKAPENITELRSFLGMVQYLGQYLSNLSTVTKPMTDLLKSDATWTWGDAQQESFQQIKSLVTDAPVLAFFDPARETVVSADASSYGIGGYVMQNVDGKLKPIAFCSRTLTSSERNYAQIEKEGLASVWTCERMGHYLTGLQSFRLITDHKPLVTLINNRDIDQAPARCQRLLLRLMKFNARAEYQPGKSLAVSDALSRNPLPADSTADQQAAEVDAHIELISASWPASATMIQKIQEETMKDETLQQAISYTVHGWPDKRHSIPPSLHAYHAEKANLSVADHILLYRDRIVIPTSLRSEVTDKIHEGHWGMTKCRERAAQSIWWPGFRDAIINKVATCPVCLNKQTKQHKEPLTTTPLPEYPWQRIGVDLFESNRRQYLVQIDYYSRFVEVSYMPSTTAAAVIGKIKTSFARFGIPQEVISDNGSQFSCSAFEEFAKSWGFVHSTCSPYHSQANGAAESGVKIAKKIVQQDDPHLALLTYHATPIAATGISPAEAMLNRKLRTSLPCMPNQLLLTKIDTSAVREKDDHYKEKMAHYYNTHHGAKPLADLHPGDRVRIRTDGERTWERGGTIESQASYRSYNVAGDNESVYRRNRVHIRPEHNAHTPPKADNNVTAPTVIETPTDRDNAESDMRSTSNTRAPITTRYGRIVKPVSKLNL